MLYIIPTYEPHLFWVQDLFCLEYFCGVQSVVQGFRLGPIFWLHMCEDKTELRLVQSYVNFIFVCNGIASCPFPSI